MLSSPQLWLILQQSHLNDKETSRTQRVSQSPITPWGTNPPVNHTRSLTMNGNISYKYLPSHQISVDCSLLEEPGPLCFEKCIIWTQGQSKALTASSLPLHTRLSEIEQLMTPDSALLLFQRWSPHSGDKCPRRGRTIHLNQDSDASLQADFCTSFEQPVSLCEAPLTTAFL